MGDTVKVAHIGSIVVYILTIPAANWAVGTFGFVPVGFGLMAPAGVYFAGIALTMRDLAQESVGKTWIVAAIVAGAALSFAVADPFIAVASATAFLFSELADFLVYQPLRKRRWLVAIAASNIVGLVIDSALFLGIAFGSLEFMPGQIVGKVWMTLLAVLILWCIRWYRRVAT